MTLRGSAPLATRSSASWSRRVVFPAPRIPERRRTVRCSFPAAWRWQVANAARRNLGTATARPVHQGLNPWSTRKTSSWLKSRVTWGGGALDYYGTDAAKLGQVAGFGEPFVRRVTIGDE